VINDQYTLADRTTSFSKDTLSFCKNEKVTLITRPLIYQLIRSATAIGANYAEANNASSKLDFRNKIFISKKEAAETKYWLILLAEHAGDKQTCSKLLDEAQHLLMIFQKIINTMTHGKPKTVKAR